MAGNAGSLESLTVEVGELESALKDGLQARRRNHTLGQEPTLVCDCSRAFAHSLACPDATLASARTIRERRPHNC